VEDESAILSMTTQMLQSLGYVVLAAASPEEGQQLAKDAVQRIDLLMTDVVMPRMNGRDLALDLLPRHPGLRCLFMSGYTADVIAHHGVIDEGVSFIQKPFSLRDLGAKIREVLGQT
jgi:DNA-binding response OmpR family regulator